MGKEQATLMTAFDGRGTAVTVSFDDDTTDIYIALDDEKESIDEGWQRLSFHEALALYHDLGDALMIRARQ
jgi:hypothetical protein